jgi:hypothetical protein
MKQSLPVVGLLAFVLFPFHGSAGERPIVAVFDMEDRTSTFDREVLDNLTEYLSAKLAEGGYQVIPREQARERLVQEKKETYSECFDRNCQIEMGRELAAQKVLSAKILRVAGQCQLAATLYDLKKAATENAATAEGSCDEESMGRAVMKVSAKLIGKTESGFDDYLTAARKKMAVTADDYLPRGSRVEVRAGQATELKLTLEAAPPYSRWGHITFWTGLGAAAFGTISGILAYNAGQDYQAGDRGAYDRSVALTGCMYSGLAAGGALMITGVVLWALAPDEDVPAGTPSGVTSFSALPSAEGGLVVSLGGRF